MAHLDTKVIYQFQLDSGEFHLLGKALIGRMTDDERQAAQELNLRLQRVRARNARLLAEQCDHSLRRAEELAGPGARG